MTDNVTAATTSFLMWLSWYPGDYKGATAFAGDCLETPAEVRDLRRVLAEWTGLCPDCGAENTGAGTCINCGGFPV